MSTNDEMDRITGYVLGTMEADARDAFEAEMLRDAGLRARVDRLAGQMSALDDTALPEAVPEGLWAQIETRLGATPQLGRVTPFPPAAARRRGGFVGRQAALMAASLIVAAAVGYFAGGQGTGLGPRDPVVIAVLVNEADGSPGAIVEAFGDDSVNIVSLENFVVPEGKVLEVWTLPDADTGPVSLGQLPQAQRATLSGPNLPLPDAGQLYEITLEDAPASPTGRPTGPILVKGFARVPVL
ncbi:anti-sigma factor [Arsenicitalea aurantiaca]|uniref:Anti-sigma factor n=1 Tax=Arsenicitalea aurantiaca TaxID=1783274 RepID=A0A433XEL8_9HYPH|nr:anti-sigma factor [Arsenicitalea aurantiaca]RUT32506.1 anti-sigma factor [Arsenicitalea aurantiaca]